MISSILCNNTYIEKFNDKYVYINKNSFRQNNKIKKDLRFYVFSIISNHKIKINSIVCIGGESYLFVMTSDKINNTQQGVLLRNIIHYTNSKSIYNDAKLNNNLYLKNLNNNIIDYNTYSNIVNGTILILNLAKLNLNLLNVINKRIYKTIIIINCHHNEFWKRIILLTNYKLTSRKQFISNNNYVTVNVLVYKNEIPKFISLGTTCASAYQLKNLGLKNNKYPFDWCKSNINKINITLKNNFDEYNKITVNKLSNNHQFHFQKNTSSYIVSNQYNISFAHELFNISDNNIIKFQDELTNRINTFKSKKDNYVIFVLSDFFNNTKSNNICNQLDLLITNLKKYFNNFKLLYITNSLIDYTSSNNLKIIYTGDIQFVDWMYPNYNWFEILNYI